MSAENRDKGDSADRRLDAAVTQYLQAIDNGESPDREQLIAEHPDLAVDLRDFFAHRDRMQELLDPLRSAAARVLNVRCPHCHNVVELLDHSELTDIDCPKCGSSFSLVTDSVGDHMPGGSGRIGQFQLIEQVGVGQFGNVWKARDLTLERTVAIKIPRSSGLNQAETEMFLRDARFAAQLAHQNIVSVHEVGKHEDVIYIVSDFIEGKTLKHTRHGRMHR